MHAFEDTHQQIVCEKFDESPTWRDQVLAFLGQGGQDIKKSSLSCWIFLKLSAHNLLDNVFKRMHFAFISALNVKLLQVFTIQQPKEGARP